VKRDNKSHFILIKGRIHQEEILILKIYAPNIGHPSTLKNSNGPKTTDRPQTNDSRRTEYPTASNRYAI
jgi:hypothetical protein